MPQKETKRFFRLISRHRGWLLLRVWRRQAICDVKRRRGGPTTVPQRHGGSDDPKERHGAPGIMGFGRTPGAPIPLVFGKKQENGHVVYFVRVQWENPGSPSAMIRHIKAGEVGFFSRSPARVSSISRSETYGVGLGGWMSLIASAGIQTL